jgi:hypothetical protein
MTRHHGTSLSSGSADSAHPIDPMIERIHEEPEY